MLRLTSSSARVEEAQGTVLVYHKTTSRTFNVHSQCMESVSRERDGVVGHDAIVVERRLGERGVTVRRTMDLRNQTELPPSVQMHGGVREDQRGMFDEEWSSQAARCLPQYNSGNRGVLRR